MQHKVAWRPQLRLVVPHAFRVLFLSTRLRLAISITSMPHFRGEGAREEWGTVSFLFKGCDLCVVHLTSTYLPFIMQFHLVTGSLGNMVTS